MISVYFSEITIIFNEMNSIGNERIIDILKGNFENVPQPNSNLIRIFLSSTTTGSIVKIYG